jgi:hypothetical protein
VVVVYKPLMDLNDINPIFNPMKLENSIMTPLSSSLPGETSVSVEMRSSKEESQLSSTISSIFNRSLDKLSLESSLSSSLSRSSEPSGSSDLISSSSVDSGEEIFSSSLSSSSLSFPAHRPKRHQKKNKIARKILPITRAPSQLDVASLDDENLIKQHAFSRVNFLFLTLAAYWNKQPPTSLNSQMTIHAAILQAGVSKIPGRQAAHHHMASGLKANTSDLLQHSIYEKGITPIVYRFLEAKGFPEEEITKLKEHSANQSVIREIFEKYWPSGSIIEGTRVDALINATVCALPRDINLKCDKSVEKLREFIIPLINDCYMGKCRPEVACDQAITLIQNRLAQGVQELSSQIDLINQFDTINSECIQIEKKAESGMIQDEDYHNYRKSLIQLYEIAKQLSNDREVVAKCKLTYYKFYKSAFKNIQMLREGGDSTAIIKKIWLRMPKSRKDQSQSLHNTWIRGKGSEMQRELVKELTSRIQLRIYYQWELEGTQTFYYSLYFGKVKNETKVRTLLSDEELLNETFTMIASTHGLQNEQMNPLSNRQGKRKNTRNSLFSPDDVSSHHTRRTRKTVNQYQSASPLVRAS